MLRFSYLFTSVLVCLTFLNCGSNKISRGDRFEVLTEFREEATMIWSEPYSNSFNCIIPQGTILQVTINPPTGAEFFDVEPVLVDGNGDKRYIEEKLVPDHIRNREGYQGFYLSIPRNFIGEKIKKVQ